VPVDVGGDRDRGVPEVAADDVEWHSVEQATVAYVCLSVCTPISPSPDFAEAILTARSRLRGSAGCPSSVVKTNPVSVHRFEARRRSARTSQEATL
jgi:hypothetical protein